MIRDTGSQHLYGTQLCAQFAQCQGAFVSATGIAAPILAIGTALGVISTGLIYTLDIGSGAGQWIGYPIIAGVGWGVASQLPIVSVQAQASSENMAEVIAILYFLHTVGGAFVVAAAQSTSVNVMVKTPVQTAPDVNAAAVLFVGAPELRGSFPNAQLAGHHEAYMRGLKIAFAIGLATTGAAFVTITSLQTWHRLHPAAIAGGAAAFVCVVDKPGPLNSLESLLLELHEF